MTFPLLAILGLLAVTPDAPLVRPLPADAPLAAPAPEDDPPPRPSGRLHPGNYLVPALETVALDFSLLAFSNLVSREPFALVTWNTVGQHLNGKNGWTWDTDYFVTNQLGHPYQGAMSFMAARSSGLSFWVSCLFPALESLAWEYGFERDAPSINDQITTTLGGILLGEALFRSYEFLVDPVPGEPGWVAKVIATILGPPAALNRLLLDGRSEPWDLDHAPPFYFSFVGGISDSIAMVSASGNEEVERTRLRALQGSLGGELIYGQPGDPDWHYRYPFSHFDVRASLTFPQPYTGSLYIRGLLAGGQYATRQGALRGLWGAFGLYDFGANDTFQISSVGAGFGTSLQWRLSQRNYLLVTGIVGAIGFGAAGSLGLNPDLVRDYHVGPGAEGLFEAAFVRRKLAQVKVSVNHWRVIGAYVQPFDGYEAITYVTTEVQFRVARHVTVGLQIPIAVREYRFSPDPPTALLANSGRLTVGYLSDDLFGTAGR